MAVSLDVILPLPEPDALNNHLPGGVETHTHMHTCTHAHTLLFLLICVFRKIHMRYDDARWKFYHLLLSWENRAKILMTHLAPTGQIFVYYNAI